MGWESIGSVDTGQLPNDLDWLEFCQDLAIRYIEFVCGPPPPGSKLGIMQNDHDLGSYPSIGVWSEFSPEFDYIHGCEDALDVFNNAVEWETLKDYFHDRNEAGLNDDDDDEEIEDAD